MPQPGSDRQSRVCTQHGCKGRHFCFRGRVGAVVTAIRVLALLVPTVGLGANAATVTVIKQLDFNQDGALPSAEPDIVFYNSTHSLETDLYSVSGGLLQQRTLPPTSRPNAIDGNASYLFPNVALSGNQLDSRQDVSIEARVRVSAISSGATKISGGAYFELFDGSKVLGVFFQPGGLQVDPTPNSPNFIPLDIASFHDYLLTSPGSSSGVKLFIDGNLAFDGTAPSSSLNGFDFGDGISEEGNGANADWDFIRVSQSSPGGNLLADGSFETPIVSGVVSYPPGSSAIAGWTTGGDGVVFQTNGPYTGILPADGLQQIGFHWEGHAAGGSTIAQAFTTTPGQHYLLQFNVAAKYDNTNPNASLSLRADVGPNAGGIDASLSVAPAVSQQYVVSVLAFTASSSTTRLLFSDTSPDQIGADIFIDAVRVTLDDGTWTLVTPAGTPPGGRAGHSCVFDPGQNRVIVFGGFGVQPALSDVWSLSLGSSPAWSQLQPSGPSPGGRADHSSILDPIRDRMIVFGGSDGANNTNNTWALSLGGAPSWSQLQPTGPVPSARQQQSAIYDPLRDRVVAFGGSTGSAALNDVWSLTLSGTPTWSQLAPSGAAPPSRYGATAIFDPIRDRMVVFGGYNPSTDQFLNDVWALSLSGAPAWSQLSPPNPPPGRYGHDAIYDPGHDQMVVFAGYDHTNRDDTWALSLSGTPQWTQLATGGVAPPPRYDGKVVYDPAGGRMVAFGGDNPSLLNDTWALPLGDPCAVTSMAPPPFRFAWGTTGAGNGQFNDPTGVAVDGAGNVYVADSNNNRVEKFTSTGAFVLAWGTSGSGTGQFNAPISLAIDGQDHVFVVDYLNHRIQKFAADGTFIRLWGSLGTGNGQFAYPVFVAVDAAGDVYVADRNNNRIQKFTNDGQFVTAWGSGGSGPGQFDQPHGIAVDAAGDVYVVDQQNFRIQKFSSAGTFLTAWGSFGSGVGQFNNPYGIEIDGQGRVLVADRENNRIQEFDCDGAFLGAWGTPGPGPGQFEAPHDLAIGAQALVYVADAQNQRIEAFGSNVCMSTIVASAGAGGIISPSGPVSTLCGASQTFTITPAADGCHTIADVSVDGISQGPVASYTFPNVQANHTISASFAPVIDVAAIAFERGHYGPGAVAVLSMTVHSRGPERSVTLAPVLNLRFGDSIVLDPRTIAVGPDSTVRATFTWPVPSIVGQTFVDVTVSASAGGCAAQGGALGATVLNELTDEAIAFQQQQLLACGTSSQDVCARSPTSIVESFIPLLGTIRSAEATVQDGCLAANYMQQGRPLQSAAMWVLAAAKVKSTAVGVARDFACATGPGCFFGTAAEAADKLLSATLNADLVCLTAILDRVSGQQFAAHPRELVAASDPLVWLPDSLQVAVADARDSLENLALCRGPVHLRIEADNAFTTADSIGHVDVSVVLLGNLGVECAHIGRGCMTLMGTTPTRAATIHLVADSAGSCDFVLLHRTSSGGTLRLRYASFLLNAHGHAFAAVAEESNTVVLNVDQNGDGIVDWLYFPNGTVVSAPTSALPPDGPAQIHDLRCVPNPVRGATRFQFAVRGDPRQAQLVIRDVAGRTILALRLGRISSDQTVIWDGRNAAGTPVAPGMYFWGVAYAGGASDMRRVVLLR